jgi:hypothetical protein
MMRYPNSSRTASTAITSNATAIAATPNGPRASATNFRLVRIRTHLTTPQSARNAAFAEHSTMRANS